MIRVNHADGLVDATTHKRWDGNTWQPLTIAKRWNGEQWIDLLGGSGGTPNVWNVTAIWTYLNSGAIQTAHKNEPIHGSYDGSSGNARRSLLFFDAAAIRAALAGKTIKKVELYLKRLNDGHGQPTAYACIKKHNFSGKQATWKGADEGDAGGSQTLTRGQSKWITLSNTVGEQLRDNKIKGLCLDADSNYTMSRYIKYSSDIKLRITYE